MRAHYDEQGLDHPAEFYAPDLLPGADLYLKAFNALAADRPLTVGMAGVLYGRIPFESIDRFAVREGIDQSDDFDQLRRIVVALDLEEVERLNKEANKKP